MLGKFLFVGNRKFYVRGVAYGPFGPDDTDETYGSPATVAEDFARLVATGFNTVRTYSAPPKWFLDAASVHGLRVMVGLAWEQHIAFLDDRRRARAIEENVRRVVRSCAGHPAILCYTIGNEISAPIVRWYHHRRLEQFLERLYHAVKREDPAALVTYVNYPSTEYLELPFLDFVSFNLYLETPEKLESYLARLQNIADNRPLVLAEIGLDSLRNGEEKQADVLDWQVRAAFACGAAGVVVFSWTDQWFRGGSEITDWAFGLTARDRTAKPALHAVSRSLDEIPFPPQKRSPLISVIVCTYNGQRTIAECLDALMNLDYPEFDVIVVDDGSTDGVAEIANRYRVNLIRTENQGLSRARNTGLAAARGEIVAYIDDDAYPDRHWLRYLAHAFDHSSHVGIGGPNIPPGDDGLVADCVACAPGGPVHVLLTDQEAEHIPGCNMAFRREALEAIGGFDPQFRIAGDDVDVCWRLQARGWTLGFSPAAMVWHHRRNTVRGYYKQQFHYGKAEADLERKWPEKYNAVGHLTWTGRLYGPGFFDSLNWWGRRRIYHGQWGSALFQSVYHAPPSLWASLPMMPEWYVLILFLATASLPGLHWLPLALSLMCTAVTLVLAWTRTTSVSLGCRASKRSYVKRRLLTAALYLIQPIARLLGRVRNGLHPWRRRGARNWTLPWKHSFQTWSEQWRSSSDRICELEKELRGAGAVILRGGDFDRWDVEVRGGMFGAARIYLVVEEHGQGRQLARFSARPKWSPAALLLATGLLGLSASAAASGSAALSTCFATVSLLLLLAGAFECGAAVATVISAANAAVASAKPRPATPKLPPPVEIMDDEADELKVVETAR